MPFHLEPADVATGLVNAAIAFVLVVNIRQGTLTPETLQSGLAGLPLVGGVIVGVLAAVARSVLGK